MLLLAPSGNCRFVFDTNNTSCLVLTAHHIVASMVNAEFPDLSMYDSKGYIADVVLVGYDQVRDVAVVKYPCDEGVMPLPIAEQDLQNMIWVASFARPYQDGLKFHVGRTVEYWFRSEDWVIIHDVMLGDGYSGGPVVNMDGEVIGMNIEEVGKPGGPFTMGGAMPASEIRKALRNIDLPYRNNL